MSQEMEILNHINRKLNQNRCVTHGGWGECPVISNRTGHYGVQYQVATIYWWHSPPPWQTVRDWFSECGVKCISISHCLWSDDGTSEADNHGIITWDISFLPK